LEDRSSHQLNYPHTTPVIDNRDAIQTLNFGQVGNIFKRASNLYKWQIFSEQTNQMIALAIPKISTCHLKWNHFVALAK